MNENGKIPQIINLLSTVLRGIRLNINALPFTLAPRDTKVLLSQINIKVNSVIQSFHSLCPFECTWTEDQEGYGGQLLRSPSCFRTWRHRPLAYLLMYCHKSITDQQTLWRLQRGLWQRTTQREFWKIPIRGMRMAEWKMSPPHPSPSFQNAIPPLNKYSAFFLFRSRSQTWRLPDVSQQNRRPKRHLDLMKRKLSIQFRNVSKTRKPCEFAGVELFKKNCSSEKERQICLNAFKIVHETSHCF